MSKVYVPCQENSLARMEAEMEAHRSFEAMIREEAQVVKKTGLSNLVYLIMRVQAQA